MRTSHAILIDQLTRAWQTRDVDKAAQAIQQLRSQDSNVNVTRIRYAHYGQHDNTNKD